MILTCPQCATRYLLPAHMLAPEGRRVKCSACGEIWHQVPDPSELEDAEEEKFDEIPEAVRPLAEGANLPVIHEEKKKPSHRRGTFMGHLAAASVLLAVFGGFLWLHEPVARIWPVGQGFYDVLGLKIKVPGEGLVFDGLSAQASPGEDGDEKLTISGHIVNLTGQTLPIPMIEAVVRGEQGETIEHWIIKPPSDSVGPGGDISFSTEYKITGAGTGRDVNLHFTLSRGRDSRIVEAGGGNNQAPSPGAQAH